jgi:hypothetical protein
MRLQNIHNKWVVHKILVLFGLAVIPSSWMGMTAVFLAGSEMVFGYLSWCFGGG